jgi:small neutral amino acid transporter SnatA (MarC family)
MLKVALNTITLNLMSHVILRSLDEKDKSIALGMQSFLYALAGMNYIVNGITQMRKEINVNEYNMEPRRTFV